MLRTPDTSSMLDNELLMRYCRRQDEAAFRELVGRYTGLVMSVCRRVTRNEQDAEDAFQATFIIFARKADSLIKVSSVGGWLHQVAFRTALRATRKRSGRRERSLATEPLHDSAGAFDELHRQEVGQILHEELQKLSPLYREAIILCDLDGNTRAAAAARMDCTEGSVKAALARGRRQLRVRLLKRGVALSAVVALASAAVSKSKSSVPPRTVDATIRMCVSPTQAESIQCPSSVRSLVQKGSHIAMYNSLLKPVAAVGVALILVIPTLAVVAQFGIEEPQDLEDVIVSQRDEHERLDTTVSGLKSKEADESPAPKRSPTLEALQLQRIATLREIVQVMEDQYSTGQNDLASVLRAKHNLLRARLEHAVEKTQRLQLLQEQLEEFRQLETVVQTKVDAGIVTNVQLLSVRAERLAAQIELVREQDKEAVGGRDHRVRSSFELGPVAE